MVKEESEVRSEKGNMKESVSGSVRRRGNGKGRENESVNEKGKKNGRENENVNVKESERGNGATVNEKEKIVTAADVGREVVHL